MGHPYAGIVQSGLLDLLDGAKLSRPVRHSLATVLVSCVPPNILQRVTGAYDKACIRWVDLQCQKASVLESHERVKLIPLMIAKDCNAPLWALSKTVLIYALCILQAIFPITMDGICTYYVVSGSSQPGLHRISYLQVD